MLVSCLMATRGLNFCQPISISNVVYRKLSTQLANKGQIDEGLPGQQHQETPDCSTRRIKSQFYQHSFKSFDDMIQREKQDAKNYILVDGSRSRLELMSREMFETMLDSEIENMYKYTIPPKKYCLIKLKNYEAFARSNCNNFAKGSFPIYSRVYTMLPDSVQNAKFGLGKSQLPLVNIPKLRSSWGETLSKESGHLSSDQFVDRLVQLVLLNEFEAKLRFFLVNQLEELLCKGPFNQLQMFPFGSTVNGFGWNQSDLDLVMTPILTDAKQVRDNPYGLVPHSEENRCRSDREQAIHILSMLPDLMRGFIPGVEEVVPILRARVPIIKFNSEYNGIECDLTYQPNMRDTGIDIAHVLYEFSRLDVRVIKLMVFVKLWAKHHGITKSVPGTWINNFGLMMLVVHFCQIRNSPLLPPISSLNIISDPYRVKIKQPSPDKYDQHTPFMTILSEFFMYLATFDFEKYGCNVMDGLVVTKNTKNSLYIENPTHRHLNVCKNVVRSEVTKMTNYAKRCLELLNRGEHITKILNSPSRVDISDILYGE